MSERAQALESLLANPGWHAFTQHVFQEWGPTGVQYNAELRKALNLTDNDAAASQARQILANGIVIAQLVAWPAEELVRLTRSERVAEPAMSRRGGL